jgi:transposase
MVAKRRKASSKRNRQLDSTSVGALPIVNHFIHKIHVEELLRRFLPEKQGRGRRPKVPPEQTLLVLLRNLVVARLPLYRIPEWCRGHVPDLFELTEADLLTLHDERFARALDVLYEADRRSLVTQVIREAVRAFKVNLRQIHNDTTSITFFGKYEARDILGTILLCRGFNKDHRPDLKQLVFSVCASADGDVPVHFKLFDGNRNDDQIHCEIWDDLREFIGDSNFIYVADCKLCTRTNMHHIDSQQGKFITVLPRSRKEDAQFRDWVQENPIPWEAEKKLPNPRRKSEPPHIFRVFESRSRSSEGYRIIWVWDSLKAAHDALTRKESIDDAVKDLEELQGKIGKRRLKTRRQVQDEVTKILVERKATKYITTHVDMEAVPRFKQARPGRPSAVTPYVRESDQRVTLSWVENAGYIRWEAKTDGLFPLITNIEKDGTTHISKTSKARSEEGEEGEEFSPMRILEIYKHQPYIEKLHVLLKSVIRVMPVWLKDLRRIEAMLSLVFIAQLICMLIQRKLRLEMKNQGIEELPIYPEEKECKKPTARIILELYESQRRHQLFLANRLEQTFWDELSPLQTNVLSLLGVDPAPYGHRKTEGQK